MFKFTGILFVSISIMLLFNKGIIMKHFSYIFLKETTEILLKMKNACISGKTYKHIFEKMNFDKYMFYSSYGDMKYMWLVIPDRAETVYAILKDAGKRVKHYEIEYIDTSINIIKEIASTYKIYCDENRKTYMLSAVSMVMIVIIVFI